jgi:RNA polymerase sigma factor (sigma-70 family)
MFSDEMESFIEAADLSDLQIEVLRYLFLYEMKTKEIIEITGLSKSKISRIQKKALEKLQAVISAV